MYLSEYRDFDSSYDYLKIPYQEVYSTNYVEDGLRILNYIKLNPNIFMNKISYVEYHPFFQFYGNSTIFYYNCGGEHIPILYLYENNKRSIPFKKFNLIKKLVELFNCLILFAILTLKWI